jgi:acyl dehydratase
MSEPEAPLIERLRALVGVDGSPDVARDPVNLPMIRHWCDAMGDANPVYTDPDLAAKSVHGALVAPPAMLNAWTMPGLPGRPRTSEGPNAMRLLDDAGFTSVIATNSEHEYARYLRLGDRLHGENELVEVSEEKRTALGLGHFVTSRTRYRTDDGEEGGRMIFRILRFRPGTGRSGSGSGTGRPAPRTPAERPPRPARRETTRRFAEVSEGEALPPCPEPITTTGIVAAAIASRDYQDVHHDKDAAIRRGTPDIFMNILTSSGLVARYVTDWAGPEALLTSLRIRLGAPNYPGDVMTFSGRVRSATDGDVEIELAGTNSLGDHVTGTVGSPGDPSRRAHEVAPFREAQLLQRRANERARLGPGDRHDDAGRAQLRQRCRRDDRRAVDAPAQAARVDLDDVRGVLGMLRELAPQAASGPPVAPEHVVVAVPQEVPREEGRATALEGFGREGAAGARQAVRADAPGDETFGDEPQVAPALDHEA